jgi:hypothetical protein
MHDLRQNQKIRQANFQLIGITTSAFTISTVKFAVKTSAIAKCAPLTNAFNRLREFGGCEGVANDGCHDDEGEDECLHYVVVLV